MTWVRLDDQFLEHPRVVAAGRDARDLYLAGLCYCSRHLTDGLIPAPVLRRLAADAEIDDGEASAARLVRVGLWTATEDGWTVHDYLDYQPSRDQMETARRQTADRVAAWRDRQPSPAPNGPETQPDGEPGRNAVTDDHVTLHVTPLVTPPVTPLVTPLYVDMDVDGDVDVQIQQDTVGSTDMWSAAPTENAPDPPILQKIGPTPVTDRPGDRASPSDRAAEPTQNGPESAPTMPATHTGPPESARAPPYSAEFGEFWAAYARKLHRHAAWLAWQRALRDGAHPADLIAAATNAATYHRQIGDEQRFIPHPATFLGPRHLYETFVGGVPTVAVSGANGSRAPPNPNGSRPRAPPAETAAEQIRRVSHSLRGRDDERAGKPGPDSHPRGLPAPGLE